jgi:protein SCO1/2
VAHAKAQSVSIKLRFFFGCFVILTFLFGTSDDGSVAAGPQGEPAMSQAGRDEVTYHGGLVTPPLPKPKFTLTDTFGAPYDLWSNTKGYLTLLFFGYTYCPDECPLHMHNIASALQKVPTGVVEQIKVVFVTTDPERDSAKVLRSWLDNFDERFIGLTGSEAAIEAAQREAGIAPATKSILANGDYAVGHAAFVFAYSKDNFAHLIYPSGMTEEDWAHDLPYLVNEDWSNR